ncbi:MAG: hypothetical protein Q9226_008017 [Calogaya cf. arnoldii]
MIISPDLYWPVNLSTPPIWPNLREHHVTFKLTAPDGTWYFVESKPQDEDDGSGDSDDPDEEIRDIPLDSRINSLLLAMARAAACMPKLQHMTLSSYGGKFDVRFYAAGRVRGSNSQPGEADKPRLYLYMGTWEPSEEVIQVWRESKEGLLVKRIKPYYRCFKR